MWNFLKKKSKNHNVDCMEYTGNGLVNYFILYLSNYKKFMLHPELLERLVSVLHQPHLYTSVFHK